VLNEILKRALDLAKLLCAHMRVDLGGPGTLMCNS